MKALHHQNQNQITHGACQAKPIQMTFVKSYKIKKGVD